MLPGSVMIVAAIVFCGGTFAKFAQFADFLRLQFISEATFYRVQQRFVFPVIQAAWATETARIKNMLSGKKFLSLYRTALFSKL